MKDIFSIKRFALLFAKYWQENYRKNILQATALFIIMFLFYGFAVFTSLRVPFSDKIPTPVFIIGLAIATFGFAASYYGLFSSKPKSIQALQLPASNLEKFLLGFVLLQVFVFVVFLGLFYINDFIFTKAYNYFKHIPEGITSHEREQYHATAYAFSCNNELLVIFLKMYVIACPAIHFCSLWFSKNIVIKSIVVIVSIALLIFFFNYYFMQLLIPLNIMPRGMFINESFVVRHGNQDKYSVMLSATWVKNASTFLLIFCPIILWYAGYKKLTEKQV
jgi:hypothetical protein